MNQIKKLFYLLTPPIFVNFLKKIINIFRGIDHNEFTGDYLDWKEVKNNARGYESPNILEKCKNALLKVKNGEAIYERDSVVFDQIQYNYGLLAGLQRCTLENNCKLSVLDFGGSLGSTYYQNKEFLNGLEELQWSIVEQSHFVQCGKINFENKQLKFYQTIEECLGNRNPNILILSGVLQYLENPYDWIEKFVLLGFQYIIISRTAFVEGEREILTVQKIPSSIYEASFPHLFFNKKIFLNSF